VKKSIMGALALVSALAFTPAWAVEPIQTGWFSDVAVDGYDVVAYFDQGKPVKGTDEFSTKWKGAEWHFASADHLARFTSDPEGYAPQYGGYCAWAVAHNDTATGDPQLWTVYNGRLYLNYNADIKQKWVQDKDALIREADGYWPGLVDQ